MRRSHLSMFTCSPYPVVGVWKRDNVAIRPFLLPATQSGRLLVRAINNIKITDLFNLIYVCSLLLFVLTVHIHLKFPCGSVKGGRPMQLFALVLSYYWVGVYSQCLINIFLTLLLVFMCLSRQDIWFLLVSMRCLATSPELRSAVRSCRGLTTCQAVKVFHKPRCLRCPRIGTCNHTVMRFQCTEAAAAAHDLVGIKYKNKTYHFSPYKGVTEVQLIKEFCLPYLWRSC